MTDTNYWAMGITGIVGLAGSGLLGRKVQGIVAPNPVTPIARPASAPPSAPVEGQQGYSGSQPTRGFFDRNWKMMAGVGGAILLAVVAVSVLRKR